jgi:hypothetical protein
MGIASGMPLMIADLLALSRVYEGTDGRRVRPAIRHDRPDLER